MATIVRGIIYNPRGHFIVKAIVGGYDHKMLHLQSLRTFIVEAIVATIVRGIIYNPRGHFRVEAIMVTIAKDIIYNPK